MIRISRLTDYAGIVAIGLAQQPGQSKSASEISVETNIAYPTVSKILKMLNDAGLVKSLRGALGGYSLAYPSSSITLADLINAIEGVPQLTQCSVDACECSHQRYCSLKSNWSVINTSLNVLLRSITLEQMSESLDLKSIGNNFTNLLNNNQAVCEEKL